MADLLDFDFEIKRSPRRRTLCVQVRDGQVQVMVPQRTSERHIRNLVREHAQWIRNKLDEQAARPKAAAKQFVDGEDYDVLGTSHCLKIIEGPRWPVERVGDELIVTVSARLTGEARREEIRKRLLQWYRLFALEEFTRRSEQCSIRIGVSPKDVKVKTYKRRWGSCSAKGELSYNWCLIMAPECVVDYVVAHEVAHLVHHNHSQDFWRLVETLTPDYRQHRIWLHENGGLLALN